jgi:hypothetical protein
MEKSRLITPLVAESLKDLSPGTAAGMAVTIARVRGSGSGSEDA